jgi:prenyltransferase beta subunit
MFLLSVALLLPATAMADDRFEDRALEITADTREAIDRGLEYLSSQQAADGSWSGPRGRNTGVVSFAALSYMSSGVVPNRGTRGRSAARAIDYVLSHAQLNGLISNPQDTANGPMYEHAMSTLLLAEAWGMYHRPGVLDALQRAVDLIISSQNDQGGWRYDPRPSDADVSVTVMQLVALRAAKDAGIRVPRRTFENAIQYVKSCAMPNGGFVYQPGVGTDGYARTAAGVCSLLTSGDYESPETLNGIRYLQERKSRDVRGDQHLHYALYYAAQAMYQAPDAGEWREWFPPVRDELLSLQQPDGHWQGEAGPVYGTAMSILALTVPYRYLPVYQH